jgi:hypothetical protein
VVGYAENDRVHLCALHSCLRSVVFRYRRFGDAITMGDRRRDHLLDPFDGAIGLSTGTKNIGHLVWGISSGATTPFTPL